MFLYLFTPFLLSLSNRAHKLIWRDDQKPLRFEKKKKNIFGCHLVNAFDTFLLSLCRQDDLKI